MIFDFLDSVRKKPVAIRQRYVLGFAAGFTFLVGAIWTLSLPARFSLLAQDQHDAEVASASPFMNMWRQIKSQVADVSLPKFPVSSSTATSSDASSTVTYDARLLLSTTTASTSKITDGETGQPVLIEIATSSLVAATTSTTTSTSTP